MRTLIRLLGPLTVAGLLLAGCATEIGGRASRGPSSFAATGGFGSTSGSTSGSGGATSGPDPGSSDPSRGSGPLEGKIPRPTPGGKGAGTIPAGLADFYNQQLDWQRCEPFNSNPDLDRYFSRAGLDCANLIVPLDYDDPGGTTVTVAVLRSKATGQDRVGAIQMNPGGPGGSGVEYVAQINGDGVSDTLHESFDFIGFDTRGLGASRPLIACQTDAEKDATRAANYRTNTPEGVAELTDRVAEYVQQCVDRTGRDAGIDGASFLVTMGTDVTVKDMDVLRSALGEEKLTYLGYSYGTLLGTEYAARFTANVRALVLDGAVDPTADDDQEEIDQYTGFQGTFDAFAKWCAEQKSCPLGTDPGQATQKFQQLTRPLLDKPLELSDGRVLTYGDAITGTVTALYSDQIWETLRTGIGNLSDGDGYLLMALADYYSGRDSAGRYTGGLDVLTAVRCMDDERSDPKSTDTSRQEAVAEAAPFQDSGDPIVAIPSACSLWPGETTLRLAPSQIKGLAPVVVISTTGDPATPYQAGVTLAESLGGALITVQGDRHTAYLSAGSECVDAAATEYLVDLTLPDDGLTCQ